MPISNSAQLKQKKADKLADNAKKLKKGIEYGGTVIGSGIGGFTGAGAGTVAAPGPGTAAGGALGASKGAIIGAAVTLPVAHYIAEAKHTVQSKEFKKGYNDTRKSGELCIIM
jgi:hypothetical protein